MPAVPNVSFGVIIELNEKPVPLMVDAEALKKIKTDGLDIDLPEPVGLGQIGKDISVLSKMIKRLVPDAPNLPSVESLPDEIQKILKTVDTLNLRVDELRLHIPPPGAKTQDFRYALRIAAEWSSGEEKTIGPIKVKGFAFGVESPKATADTTPDKPK